MAIDFKAMLRPVAFAAKAPADTPKPLIRPAPANRRLAALREAAQVLDVLPGPGESLHAIMSGRYDLTDLLEVILTKLGTVRHLRIATLSFNRRNVQLIQGWLEAGKVQELTLLFSEFFASHNPETVEELRQAAPGQRIAAGRNHCKVVCFEFANGVKMVCEGSANLRTNSNREQFFLVSDPVLHDWHAAWIDEQVGHHGPNE